MKNKKPSLVGLILCNILGIHNKCDRSRLGVVRYCSRCGIITKDGRKKSTYKVKETK